MSIREQWAFNLSAQAVSSLSRIGPRKLEITFDAPVTDAELINIWLLLKREFIPATQRPEGWEPSKKDNPNEWEEV